MICLKYITILFLCWGVNQAEGPDSAQIPQEIEVADQPDAFQWAGDQFVITNSAQATIKTKKRLRGDRSVIQLPDGAVGQSLWNGVVTSFRVLKNRTALSRRAPDGTWQDFPTALDRDFGTSQMRGFPFLLFESTREGRFFSYSRVPGFVRGEGASICSWWKQGPHGVLEPDDLIPLDLDSPVFLAPPRAPHAGIIATSNRYRGLEPFLDVPLRFAGGFVVVSWGAGIIWIISDDPTISNRTIHLSASDPDFLSGKKRHHPALLGIQITPANRVLAALRSDELLYRGFESKEKDPEHSTSSREDVDNTPKAKELFKIVWKEIDPREGTVTEPDGLDYPGAPGTFDPTERFTFCFDLNGNMVLNGQEAHPSEGGQAEDGKTPDKADPGSGATPKALTSMREAS